MDNKNTESTDYTIHFKSSGTATISYPREGIHASTRKAEPLNSYSFIGINSLGSSDVEVLNASRNPSYDLVLAWYKLSPLGHVVRQMIEETGSLEALEEDFEKVFAPPLVV